jgi:uncharacterized caspase-like protein
LRKGIAIRRPDEDYPVAVYVRDDGANGPSLLFRAGDVLTIVALDAALGDGRTVRGALLEALLKGCTVAASVPEASAPPPAPAPAAGAGIPTIRLLVGAEGEPARSILFEHDADGNITRAVRE